MTESVQESTWSGLIAGSRQPPGTIGIQLVLEASTDGLAGSFRALGTDGQRWWIKPPGQGDRDFALVTEHVVGRLGALIGAPTCGNAVVDISQDFVGWEYARGKVLSAGLGMERRKSMPRSRSGRICAIGARTTIAPGMPGFLPRTTGAGARISSGCTPPRTRMQRTVTITAFICPRQDGNGLRRR